MKYLSYMQPLVYATSVLTYSKYNSNCFINRSKKIKNKIRNKRNKRK